MELELHKSETDGKQEKEFLRVPFEIKEVVEDGTDSSIAVFSGHAAAFNNRDLGRDIIIPGAFLNTMKKDGVVWPILHSHNTWSQIGWNAEASEDKQGLFVKGELNLDVQLAKEQYALAKQCKSKGGKMGLSIGYQKEIWEIDQEKRVRYLRQVKMYEYSFVLWPMNPKARISQIKSELEDLTNLDLSDCGKSARLMESILREVGLSRMQAKAYAGSIVRLNEGESLREVGFPESSEETGGLKAIAGKLEDLVKSLRD